MDIFLQVSDLACLDEQLDLSFLELISTADGAGVYRWDGVLPAEGSRVSHSLHSLLDSAIDYPPAMAMIRYYFRSERIQSFEEFEKRCCEKLEAVLAAQCRLSFKLARVRLENSSDFDGEGYYWVIRDSEQRYGYWWVTRDYFLVRAQSCDFDIEPEILDELDIHWVESGFSIYRLRDSAPPEGCDHCS